MEEALTVQNLLKQVAELSDEDKFSFLTKLPTEVTQEDLEKDTPSSMSRRSKAAVSWLQCKYEEDNKSCVHKQDIYEHYIEDCASTGQLPICGTNFGKIIKMVFPSIYNRRLGQRGQSKQCYWGLKRREDLQDVSTYDSFHCYTELQSSQRSTDSRDMYHLSCQLVCEWASQLLDKPFSDIRSLSEYLISIGLSCGKTAAMFTLMSGSTSPPKLSTEKKTLSTRLVQRRLQHNEIIRKHKDKIKQQLKLQREQQAAMAQQKKGYVSFEHTSGQATIFSSSGTTILPRPLSVQPYMCSSTTSTDHHATSIWCVSSSYDKTPASGHQAQIIQPKLSSVHSLTQTKRCQSTSLVEKHLVSPYNLQEPLLQEHTNKSLSKKIEENEDLWSPCLIQDQRGKQTVLLSTSDCTSRSPSISPITTAVVGCAARNISRLLESPAPSLVTIPHQNKRNGDDMSHAEEAFVKKRCTTSIGVEKQDSLDLNSRRKEDDFTVVRPYSCPISFHDPVRSNKTKRKGVKSLKGTLKSKCPESLSTGKENPESLTETKNLPEQKSEGEKEAKSYHFVQKPQAISRLETSVMTSPSNHAQQEPAGRARYNILNSLLSSDYDVFPSGNKLIQPMPHTQSLTAISSSDQVPHLRRISCASHTSDTNGIRSAFVPVTSQKQQTNPTTLEETAQKDSESSKDKTSNDSNPLGDINKNDGHKSAGSDGKIYDCTNSVPKWKTKLSNFLSTTTSSSSSSSSSTLCQSGDSVVSVVDSAFATPTPITGYQKAPALTSVSAPATLSKVSSSLAPAWLGAASQSSNTGPDCTLVTTGSPNFGPKKTIKNRFTPIRPKLDSSLNISPQKLRASSTSASPQKRDMRPVHAILQEHRVKNAQDLLANLAHNYQAEIGLPTSGNSNSASVIVSFGPPKSESLQKSTPPGSTALNVFSSLPLQSPPVVVSSMSGTLFQSQVSPAMSVTSLSSESKVILLPASPHKQTTDKGKSVLVQDAKGNQYAVEKQPAGTLLFQPDLLVQPGQVVSTPNLLNLNTKQAHVVGPDAQGQTYLLVPNSGQRLSQVRSKSCVPTTVNSIETSAPLIQSSVSLTSVIPSQTNDQPEQEKATGEENRQNLKQSTAPSAFHRCSSVGSPSRLTSDRKTIFDIGNFFAKEIQEREQETDCRATIRHESVMDATTLDSDKETDSMIEEKVKAETDTLDHSLKSSTKHDAKNMTKHVRKSSDCSLRSSVLNDLEASIGIATSHISPSQNKADCSPSEVNGNVANSQFLNNLINVNTNAQENPLPQQIFRKRKATSGDSTEREGKKRTEEGEDMENVEPSSPEENQKTEDLTLQKRKSSVLAGESEMPMSIVPLKTSPLSDTSVNQTDTETLLTMIGDTKSMTVKEVVLALNKLRAKLKEDHGQKDKLLPAPESGTPTHGFDNLTPVEKGFVKKIKAVKTETTSFGHSESPLSGIQEKKKKAEVSIATQCLQRPSRRNISLNLESLENDALLDLEHGPDSELVGEVKERDVFKEGQLSRRRSSVGTAVKSQQPLDVDIKATQPDIVGMKSNKSKSSKRVDLASNAHLNTEKHPASVTVVDLPEKFDEHVTYMATKTLTPQQSKKKVVERSRSCVQDILERGISCKRDDVTHHFSSVVGFLNKDSNQELALASLGCRKGSSLYEGDDQEKDKEESNNNAQQKKDQMDKVKTKPSNDSDLPLDVIDFITESMSDDSSYQSNQYSNNPITSWLADLANCTPGTEPIEEMDIEKSSTPELLLAAKTSTEGDVKQLCIDENSHLKSNQIYSQTENYFEQQMGVLSAKAASTTCSDGTFLSPIGPARAARRPSMERSMLGERNIMRISNEQPRPPSRLKTRAETPVENFYSIPNDQIGGGKLLTGKKDPFSVRDHTTAVMLQQSVTLDAPNQIALELQPETCITSLVRQGSAELCRADRAFSETPVSDPGYSSVGQTPVSEVGGSSVSPSPVMMSLDSTFRPVRSETEINQAITDNFTCPSESDIDSNRCATYQVLAPTVTEQRKDTLVPSESTSLQPSASAVEFSSKSSFNSGSRSVNVSSISNTHDTLDALSDLEHLMSVRLQCIPTPPSSPSGSPQPQKETLNTYLPFVSVPEQKQTEKQNTSKSSFIAPLCPPNSTSSSTTATAMHRLNVSTNCPGIVANQDFTNPGIISRFSPSPHLNIRPSCSPYHHYPHPSPPFTPSSQRCQTPNTLAIMSPRSNTPCTESTAAPNRFMPIQTSGILATSLTVTQTYIQPIKPVVTLASAAGQKKIGSSSSELSGYLSALPLSTSTFTSTTSMHQHSSSSNSESAKNTQHHFALSVNPSLSKRHVQKKATQARENKSVSWIPCSISHKSQSSSKPAGITSIEKTGQPALVLSLGGNIGSVSLSSQGMGLFDHNQQFPQGGALPSYQEAVSNIAGAERQHEFPNRDISLYHTVQGGLKVKKTGNSPKSIVSSGPAPTLRCSANPDSKVTSKRSGTSHDLPVAVGVSSQQGFGGGREPYYQSTVAPPKMFQQCSTGNVNEVPTSEISSITWNPSEGVLEPYCSTFSMSHTPDDLEETLDVLKTLDSQYFQQDEDGNSSTSL